MPRMKKPGPKKRVDRIKNVPLVRLLKAIDGTGGRMSDVARRLNLSVASVKKLIAYYGEEAATALEDETNRVLDEAEATIEFCVSQRDDLKVAANTAKWLLERKRTGFKERKQFEIGGGDKPIRIQTAQIPIEALDLPIELRKQLLEAIDKREGEDAA